MRKPMTKRAVKLSLDSFVYDESTTDIVINEFFSSLDSSKSLAAAILYRNNEHMQLLDLDVDPDDYDNPDKFHRDYQAVSFLSKAKFLKTPIDKKERAMAKFLQYEEQCHQTNLRFSSRAELENSAWATTLFVMRHKIDAILGEFDIEEFFDQPAWGPGVSTLIKGNDTSATRKYSEESGITDDLYALVGTSLSSAYPLWYDREHESDSSFTIEVGNTVTTVDKNSKIDRVIAIEPGLNILFQKSAGRMIRRRLKRWGIDLTSQQANQELSLQGSRNGHLATVDFSSASDSIARKLVENLLPDRWYQVLNACRCKNGIIDGQVRRWEKFSSMGNGFTFELESLIFYVAALSLCEQMGAETKNVSVYGDDVIIPSSVYKSFSEFSDWLGFTVNLSKSFSMGPFRESCGSHYFRGVDVKPIFLQERLTDAFSIYKLANSVRRLAHRRNSYRGCDQRFLTVWRRILSGLPATLRSLKTSEGYGDGGIASNFDEACPRSINSTPFKTGWEGYEALNARQAAVKCVHDSKGLLLSRLNQIKGGVVIPSLTEVRNRPESLGRLQVSTQSFGQSDPLRGRTRNGLFLLQVHTWYDFGAWI